MATRSRKEAKLYLHHIKEVHSKTHCVFCDLTDKDPHFVDETVSFKVIKNIFPYSQWDFQTVEDHLMIVPKKHTDSLNNLTSTEAVEFLSLLNSYEAQGYNMYARAPGNNQKSVAHQHTHLIKLTGKTKHLLFCLNKPYIRFFG